MPPQDNFEQERLLQVLLTVSVGCVVTHLCLFRSAEPIYYELLPAN
jgi:hypothetical protein